MGSIREQPFRILSLNLRDDCDHPLARSILSENFYTTLGIFVLEMLASLPHEVSGGENKFAKDANMLGAMGSEQQRFLLARQRRNHPRKSQATEIDILALKTPMLRMGTVSGTNFE